MKFVNPFVHGIVDYLVVAAFAAAPTLFGFTGMTGNVCYGLAGVHLLVTLLTNMPLGAMKVIPFTVHGWIELAVAPTLAAIPWVMGFNTDPTALYFFSGFGAAVFAAWLCTDYKGGGASQSGGQFGAGTGTGGNNNFRKTA